MKAVLGSIKDDSGPSMIFDKEAGQSRHVEGWQSRETKLRDLCARIKSDTLSDSDLQLLAAIPTDAAAVLGMPVRDTIPWLVGVVDRF